MKSKFAVSLLFFISVIFFIHGDTSGKIKKRYRPVSVRYGGGYVLRKPDYKNFEKYKVQKEFIYDEEKAPVTLWDEVKAWIWKKIFNLLIFNGKFYLYEIIFYAVIVVAFILLVVALLKSNFQGLFSKNIESDISLNGIINIDDESIDYNGIIEEMIRQGDFREAVRYYYNKYLAKMNSLEVVKWKPDKTNREYILEIKSETLKNRFSEISLVFEYAWYGNFQIDKGHFLKIKNIFTKFEKELDKI